MKKYKFKRKNYKLIQTFFILAVFFIFMTIGYSLLTDTLYINGSISVLPNGAFSCDITISSTKYNVSDQSKTISISYNPDNINSENCKYEYSIDGGQTWNTYTSPFKITKTTNIQARCLAKSTNAEIGSAEKDVRVAVVQLKQYNGNNTIMGFSGTTLSQVTSIKRASDSISLEDIQSRISNGENIQKLDDGSAGEDLAVYGWKDSDGTFYWWSNAEDIFFDKSQTNAFRGLTNVTSIDLSGLNTSKCTSFNSWFWNCKKLKNIDLSGFDTSNVTTMYGMFYECNNLESLDLSNFNTSKLTNMASAFGRTYKLTSLDLSMLDTSKLTTLENTFNQATALTTLNLSGFDTSNVTVMSRTFASCESLTHLDISSFDTSKVTNMAKIFSNMNNIETIYASENFVTTKCGNSSELFVNDTNLVGGNGTTYSSSNTGVSYAKIDKDGQPGYFTLKE